MSNGITLCISCRINVCQISHGIGVKIKNSGCICCLHDHMYIKKSSQPNNSTV